MAIWKKLASTTLGSATDTLDSGTFAVNKFLYYEAFYSIPSSGAGDPLLQVNGETSDYSYQRSIDGGADSTNASTNSLINNSVAGATIFDQGYIINVSGKEKLAIIRSAYSATTGSGTAPNRREYTAKWTDTSEPITSIQINMGSGNLDADSEITVYGSEGSSSGGSPAVYPKLQDGSIYEEQDTGKIYIWKLSTNTWSEIT